MTHARRPTVPFESCIIRHKLVEVGHELVNRLPHVHVPHVGPYCVRIRQHRRLIFIRADRRLKLVPAMHNCYVTTRNSQELDARTCI